MANKRKNEDQSYLIWTGLDPHNPGANSGILYEIANLHALNSTIGPGDGEVCRFSSIRLNVDASSVGPGYFGVLLVQTDGTITDADNLAISDIETVLAAQCDDVLAYRWLIEPRMVLKGPVDPDAVLSRGWFRNRTAEIPSDIIGLINKESGTEKLQKILLVLVAEFGNGEADSVIFNYLIDARHSVVRKKITFR